MSDGSKHIPDPQGRPSADSVLVRGLGGRVTIVSDASSATGQATAFRFAAAGSRIVLVGRSVSKLRDLAEQITGRGGQALVVPADVGEYGQVQKVVATAIQNFGRVDVLVNNVDLAVSKPLLESSPSEIDEQIDANLKAVCYGCRAVLAHMVERGGGHIVNVGWTRSLGPDSGHAVYAAGKFAVLAFSRSVHDEVREHGVRVTYLCPTIAGALSADLAKASEPWPNNQRLLPEDLAELIVRCVETPEGVV